MSNMNDQANIQASNFEEHDIAKALLDAYSTNTIAEQEKALVVRHLASCQECQHELVEILHLHDLLKMPEEEIQASMLHEYSTVPVYRRGISELADRVLDNIVQKDQEGGSNESNLSFVSFRPSRSTMSRKTIKRSYLWWLSGFVAAVVGVVIWGTLSLPAISQFISTKPGNSTVAKTAKPQPIWSTPQDQTVVRQGQDVFSLKYVAMLNNHEFSLIYAFRSSQAESLPHVEVVSILPSQSASKINVISSIQTLGMLGKFNIGVIHVHVQDRVGQSIILQGTFLDQAKSWHLAIGDQLIKLPLEAPNADSLSWGGFVTAQNGLPEITANTPIVNHPYVDANAAGIYTHVISLVSLTLSSPLKTATSAMYLRLDYLTTGTPVRVTIIPQEDFTRLAGPQPKPCVTCHEPVPHPLTIEQMRKMLTATATAKK